MTEVAPDPLRRPCPFCGTRFHTRVGTQDRHGAPLETRLCNGCGLVSHAHIPRAEELNAFYAEEYRLAYKGAREPRKRQVIRNFDRVQRFFRQHDGHLLNAQRILDVGAGSGEFLFFCNDLGLTAQGIEPNGAYADFAHSRLGVTIQTAALDEVTFPPGSFDFIRLNHVLEHVADPVAVLTRLRSWLTDSGTLYLSAPNLDQDARRKAPNHLFHYGHIWNFNPWTLQACAGLAGFRAPAPVTSTSLFLQKGEFWPREKTASPENALQLKRAIGTRRAKATATRRFTKRLRSRMREAVIAARARSWKAVGEYFVDRYLA